MKSITIEKLAEVINTTLTKLNNQKNEAAQVNLRCEGGITVLQNLYQELTKEEESEE